MASGVDFNGGKLDVDSETRLHFRSKWSVGGFLEDVRLGKIQGHLGELQSDLFRIGANKFGTVHQKDILGHTGCVNAVEFNKSEVLLASGGDDMRVFVWRVADIMLEGKPKPAIVMERGHHSNIFCYQFSLDGSELYSGGNDGMVICHDVNTRKPLCVYEDRHPVYSISANPIDINIVAASREGGVVSFYDRRETKEGCFCLVDKGQLFRGQYNPSNALLFATASSSGVRVYDLRNRKGPLLDLKDFVNEAIYVEWNSTGTAITALQSHSDPTYIDLAKHCQVKLKDPQYSNVHTIKSITFMDDNTIMTGSDDFNVYAWRIPDIDGKSEQSVSLSNASFVLKGHRSIVNHVRYSRSNRIIASCGVEKIIKVWSSLPIPFSYDKPRIRVKKAFAELTFDVNVAADDTAEDLNMLNYFDQLDNFSRMHADDSPDGGIGDDSFMGLENYVVNVDMEGLRAHLMGLETSDESSDSDGNDLELTLDDDNGDGGDVEDEDTFRASVRALRRRRWRMIRNHARRRNDSTVEPGPSPSHDADNERREADASSTDDENERPLKRFRRNTGSSDSSDNEFTVCDGGIPIHVWPLGSNRSPDSKS